MTLLAVASGGAPCGHGGSAPNAACGKKDKDSQVNNSIAHIQRSGQQGERAARSFETATGHLRGRSSTSASSRRRRTATLLPGDRHLREARHNRRSGRRAARGRVWGSKPARRDDSKPPVSRTCDPAVTPPALTPAIVAPPACNPARGTCVGSGATVGRGDAQRAGACGAAGSAHGAMCRRPWRLE